VSVSDREENADARESVFNLFFENSTRTPHHLEIAATRLAE
jgi:aspartate carbamoyltransferase catalytic subunit